MFNWFKKKQAGPDFSTLDSRSKIQAAAGAGHLVPLLLMPEEFGGHAVEVNTVFVPSWAADEKRRIDIGVIVPLAQEGKISRYTAEPIYKGSSFVPSKVVIRASDPTEFYATVEIW